MSNLNHELFTVHHPNTGSYMGTVARVYGPRGGYRGSWYWTPQGSMRATEKVLEELKLHPFSGEPEKRCVREVIKDEKAFGKKWMRDCQGKKQTVPAPGPYCPMCGGLIEIKEASDE